MMMKPRKNVQSMTAYKCKISINIFSISQESVRLKLG